MGKAMDLFKEILCGDLDNRQQVANERALGKQIHPYAKHVTRVCDHRVKHRPEGHEGMYVLEESYYVYPGQEAQIKPLFFYLREQEDTVLLQSLVVPERWDHKEVVNSNESLSFEFEELVINERFGTAEYVMVEDIFFTVNHPCDFGGGITFRLVETLHRDGLSVMEITKKDGVIITPYDTPLEYKKYTEPLPSGFLDYTQ